MTDWLTSDSHFGHTRIALYSGRMYLTDGKIDVAAMDRDLVARWNSKVKPEDTVYHLGDFSLKRKAHQVAEYRKQLNGRIVLIKGNHDLPTSQLTQIFDEVHDDGVLPNAPRIYLRHIPMVNYPIEKYYAHLCGHVHERWSHITTPTGGKIINVGVDVNDLFPITLYHALHNAMGPGRPEPKPLVQCLSCSKGRGRAEFFTKGCPLCGSDKLENIVGTSYVAPDEEV